MVVVYVGGKKKEKTKKDGSSYFMVRGVGSTQHTASAKCVNESSC